jgi:hypothetical protein
MKSYTPGMIGLVLLFSLVPPNERKQLTHYIGSSNPITTEQYVFAIPIEYRINKDSVEYYAHWDYIGKFSDRIPYCAPGQLQACQLIVDERDTDPSGNAQHPRKLKSTVRIISSLNTKDHWWYVSNYIPSGQYSFIIRNEEAAVR